MSHAPLRLVTIIGSTREGRFGPTVASWFVEQAERYGGLTIDVLDLAEVRLFDPPSGEPNPAVGLVAERLASADAFVVITPEYNHSFPAPLKHAIDLYRSEWRAKPVGFVSYGGMGGGLRAVEQLRLVFAELHAMTVRDTVSFHNAWERFDPANHPIDEEGCAVAAKGLLDQLVWWAHATRDARTARPYAV